MDPMESFARLKSELTTNAVFVFFLLLAISEKNISAMVKLDHEFSHHRFFPEKNMLKKGLVLNASIKTSHVSGRPDFQEFDGMIPRPIFMAVQRTSLPQGDNPVLISNYHTMFPQ